MDELRRTYHDRIAELHDRSRSMVALAADSAERVTAAVVRGESAAARDVVADLDGTPSQRAGLEDEVLDILALQAPVARDLRMVLASLFVAQVAELCAGLVRTLAIRCGQAEQVLTPVLRTLISEIGSATVGLLRQAEGAWSVVDAGLATAVIDDAARSRSLQRQFLAELLRLSAVPVEAAVDLGMMARAYERLTDHALEIASRVVFAAGGSAEQLSIAER